MFMRDNDLLASLTELTALTDDEKIARDKQELIEGKMDGIRANYSLNKENELTYIKDRIRILKEASYGAFSGLERINLFIFILKYLIEERLNKEFDCNYPSIDTERDISIDLLNDRNIYLRSIAFSKSKNLFDSVDEISKYRQGYLKVIGEIFEDFSIFNDDQESYMELEIGLKGAVDYVLTRLEDGRDLDFKQLIGVIQKYLNLMIMTRLSSEENNRYDIKTLLAIYDVILGIITREEEEKSQLIKDYIKAVLTTVKAYLTEEKEKNIIREDSNLFISMLDGIHGLDYSEILLKTGQAEVLIKCKLNKRSLAELKDFESYNFNNYYPFGLVDDGTHQNIVKFYI